MRRVLFVLSRLESTTASVEGFLMSRIVSRLSLYWRLLFKKSSEDEISAWRRFPIVISLPSKSKTDLPVPRSALPFYSSKAYFCSSLVRFSFILLIFSLM